MKKIFNSIRNFFGILFFGCAMLALSTGCVTARKQVLQKTTVFGADIKTPGPSGTAIEVQLGLIRSLYFSNPVNSNGVAPPFHSTAHGDIGLFNQKVDESFGTSQPPEIAYQPTPVSTTDPLTGGINGNAGSAPPVATQGATTGISTNFNVPGTAPASAFGNGVTPSSVPADLTPAPRAGMPR